MFLSFRKMARRITIHIVFEGRGECSFNGIFSHKSSVGKVGAVLLSAVLEDH